MSKVTLSDIANLQNEQSVVDAINANNALTETGFENTLSRNGALPNQMGASLDMNSNRIYNLPTALAATEAVRFDQIASLITGALSTPPTVVGKATSIDAQAGTDDTKYMTALKVSQLLSFHQTAINLKAFGVVADGVTDDTAAVNSAISYANAHGGKITFLVPVGTTLISFLDPILVDYVYFKGEGEKNSCNIKYLGNAAIKWSNTSVAITGGGLINLGLIGPGLSICGAIDLPNSNFFFLKNIWCEGVDRLLTCGTPTTTASLIIVDDLSGAFPNSPSSLFGLVHGAGLYIINAKIYTDGAPPTGRGLIEAVNLAWDTVQVYDSNLQIWDYALKVNAGNGVIIGNFYWSNNVTDHFSNGFLLTAQAGGQVQSPMIRGGGGWFTNIGGNTGYGILITGAGSFVLPSIRDFRMETIGKSPIYIDATTVTGLEIEGLQFYDINTTASTNDGIYIAGGAGYVGGSITNVKHNDSFGGALPRYGINIDGVVDHYIIANNDVKGSTASYQGMVQGTVTTRAHTNFRQIGNVGLDDNSTQLVIPTGKTVTVNNSLTFTGVDTNSFTFPSGSSTVATLGAANTFTAANTFSAAANLNGTATFTLPIKLAKYLIAALPSGAAGDMAFATNCRVFNGAGTLEGAAAGTGGLVTHNGTAWKVAGTNITASA